MLLARGYDNQVRSSAETVFFDTVFFDTVFFDTVFFDTTSIYHKCDETMRDHVFCSFLALLLLKELQIRLERRSWEVEWQQLRDDLDALEEITIRTRGRTFVIRSQTQGDAGKAIQAAGVALGSVVRLEDPSHEL